MLDHAPGSRSSTAMPFNTASAGRLGVLGTLQDRIGPDSDQATTSVNVPPTSTPIRRAAVLTDSRVDVTGRSTRPAYLTTRVGKSVERAGYLPGNCGAARLARTMNARRRSHEPLRAPGVRN